MVSTNDPDHGHRSSCIRASIDVYLSPRKRNTTSDAPSPANSGEPFQLNASVSPKPKNHMSSFFSRFTSKNKSKLNLSTDSILDTGSSRTISRQNSIPSSPTVHRLSIPIVEPLPTHDTGSKSLNHFPLCVAYVQAIRTTCLPACTLSSEKILRQMQERESEKDNLRGATIPKRGRGLHRSHVSTNSADLDWTKKLFVLVPGLLLQYPADGMDDRLPEQALQLTSTSLAFASDAIPGRQWVLQVYTRSAGEDGVLLPGRKKALIAKLTFRGELLKNSASAILLVFEGAAEMDAWMGALRGEAMRLGGKNRSPSPMPVRKHPSIDDEWFTNPGPEPEADPEVDPRYSKRIVINREDNYKTESSSSSDENTRCSKRASSSTQYRISTDAERSFVSHDQLVLDQLRGPSHPSLNSRGDKIRITNVSPDTSPERYSPRSGTSYKRQSLALSTQSSVDIRPSTTAPGLSAIDKDGNLYWIPRTPSPPCNNYSLPKCRQARPLSVPSIPPVPASPGLLTVNPTDAAVAVPDPPRRPRLKSVRTSPGPTPMLPKSSPRPTSMDCPQFQKQQNLCGIPDAPTAETDRIFAPAASAPIAITPRRVSAASSPLPPFQPRSLRRRSLSALTIPNTTDLAHGAPQHPPPSMPLPKVPSPVVENPLGSTGNMGLSQSVPRSVGGSHWAMMEKRKERRRSRQSAEQQASSSGLGITIEPVETGSARKRHSYSATGLGE